MVRKRNTERDLLPSNQDPNTRLSGVRRVEPEFPVDLPHPDQGLPEHIPPSPMAAPGATLQAPHKLPGDVWEGRPRDPKEPSG